MDGRTNGTGKPLLVENRPPPLVGNRFQANRCLHARGALQSWVGVDLSSGAPVMMKVVGARALRTGTLERLFYEDARLREAHHPSLPPSLHTQLDGEWLYRVSPYISGRTLAERLARGQSGIEETLGIGCRILQALQVAHDVGVRHRHLNPSNVFVKAEGPYREATLIDFGLAPDDLREPFLPELPLSTLQYLAPEQAGLLEGEVGPASDLYAVGAMLFACLRGAPLCPGPSLGEVLQQHLTLIPELRARGLRVPGALEQVIQRLLHKDPRERYQSAAAALEDMECIGAELAAGVQEPAVPVGRTDRRTVATEPGFIGCASELQALEHVLDDTFLGRGGLVLLEGASGGGKTMLLDELARRARARGVRVLRGQGLARQARPPLQVLTGVFEDLGMALEESPALAQRVRARLGPRLDAALQVAPRLVAPLGHAPPPAPVDPSPGREGERDALPALLALLGAMGDAQRPTLVLLDDCQWADSLLSRLLSVWQRLAPSRPERFVTLVATFRTEEVPEELRKLEPRLHLRLAPLAAPQLHLLAESMAGRLPQEALETVVRLSEGNPFLASAVVRGLIESGALLPSASGWHVEPRKLAEVQASRRAASLLLRRLSLLRAETRRLLAVGAVLGRSFEVGLVATLAQRPPERLTCALAEAHQRHLLWPEPHAGRYTFAHDRLRDALLEELSDEERRALHHQAALALEQHAPERVFELAWHFEEAGEPERAFPHALAAARSALHQYDLELAERNYRLAERGASGASAAVRMALLEGLGRILYRRASYDEADRYFARALELTENRLERSRLMFWQGATAYFMRDAARAAERLTQSLRLLGRYLPENHATAIACASWALLVRWLRARLPNAWLRPAPGLEAETLLTARIFTRLSQVYCLQGGRFFLWLLWAHLRGLDLAERCTPTPELAAAYANHGATLVIRPRLVPGMLGRLARFALKRGWNYFHKALALHDAFGDTVDVKRGYTLYLYQLALFFAARYPESIEAGREAEQLLWQSRDTGLALESCTLLGTAFLQAGKLPAVLDVAQRLRRASSELAAPHLEALSLELKARATEGRIPGELLADARTRAGPEAKSVHVVRQARLLHAESLCLLGTGEPERAVDLLSQALHLLKRSRQSYPHLWSALQSRLATALREQALQVSPNTPAHRALLLRQARATARRVLRRRAPFPEDFPHPLRELGLLAALEGRGRRARRYFDRGLAIAERLGMRYEHARTLLARAGVGADLGWPDAAADAAAGQDALRQMLPPTVAPETAASLSLVDRFPRLLEMGRRLASSLTREAVFEAVREAARGLLRGERCELVEHGTGEASPPGSGRDEALQVLALRAREAGRPVVLSEEELADLGCPGVRSALATPLLVRGQVAACLVVTSRQLSGLFGEEEARIAEFLSTLAGAALENARGFAEVNALSEERQRHYEQAQAALRKRDEFLAVASHELRTPLTPLRLYLQGILRALRGPDRPPALAPWVAKLESAQARLLRFSRLVEELFDLARLSQGTLTLRPAEVDLSALARDSVERWREELSRVGCACTVDAPEPLVGHWDGLRLEQVLDNLLSNAVKYGPGKPIHLSVGRDGSLARLTVRDSGPGIPHEDQARIFERFERAVPVDNYGGFGMGLWISREVALAHRGHIFVESTPGHGATFTLELPLPPA